MNVAVSNSHTGGYSAGLSVCLPSN